MPPKKLDPKPVETKPPAKSAETKPAAKPVRKLAATAAAAVKEAAKPTAYATKISRPTRQTEGTTNSKLTTKAPEVEELNVHDLMKNNTVQINKMVKVVETLKKSVVKIEDKKILKELDSLSNTLSKLKDANSLRLNKKKIASPAAKKSVSRAKPTKKDTSHSTDEETAAPRVEKKVNPVTKKNVNSNDTEESHEEGTATATDTESSGSVEELGEEDEDFKQVDLKLEL